MIYLFHLIVELENEIVRPRNVDLPLGFYVRFYV